jgi:hypothetical protein
MVQSEMASDGHSPDNPPTMGCNFTLLLRSMRGAASVSRCTCRQDYEAMTTEFVALFSRQQRKAAGKKRSYNRVVYSNPHDSSRRTHKFQGTGSWLMPVKKDAKERA